MNITIHQTWSHRLAHTSQGNSDKRRTRLEIWSDWLLNLTQFILNIFGKTDCAMDVVGDDINIYIFRWNLCKHFSVRKVGVNNFRLHYIPWLFSLFATLDGIAYKIYKYTLIFLSYRTFTYFIQFTTWSKQTFYNKKLLNSEITSLHLMKTAIWRLRYCQISNNRPLKSLHFIWYFCYWWPLWQRSLAFLLELPCKGAKASP